MVCYARVVAFIVSPSSLSFPLRFLLPPPRPPFLLLLSPILLVVNSFILLVVNSPVATLEFSILLAKPPPRAAHGRNSQAWVSSLYGWRLGGDSPGCWGARYLGGSSPGWGRVGSSGSQHRSAMGVVVVLGHCRSVGVSSWFLGVFAVLGCRFNLMAGLQMSTGRKWEDRWRKRTRTVVMVHVL